MGKKKLMTPSEQSQVSQISTKSIPIQKKKAEGQVQYHKLPIDIRNIVTRWFKKFENPAEATMTMFKAMAINMITAAELKEHGTAIRNLLKNYRNGTTSAFLYN